MIGWEIKKIIKNKSSIIALLLMSVLFLQSVFVKPMLETQNEYYDEKNNKYVVDNRQGVEIASDKLSKKVSEIKETSKQNSDLATDKSTNKIINNAKEKLKKDNGENYQDIIFYQVFESRATFAIAILLIIAIIVTISSNLYTDEKLSNVSPIILASKNKKKVLNSKLLISILLPIVIYGIYIMVVFLVTSVQYGLPTTGYLQAYRIANIPMLVNPININEYIVCEIGLLMIVLITISVFSGLFSFITENSVQSISAILIFIALGKLLTLLKFLPSKLLGILAQGNFIDIIMGQSQIAGNYLGDITLFSNSISISIVCILLIGTVFILGIALNIFTFKKIITK